MADSTETVDQNTEQNQQQENSEDQQDSKAQGQSVELSDVAAAPDTGSGSIDILLDMDIPVTVAIGQIELPVRRLLQLGPGSVLKLDKPVDSPVDLYLKETKFATGNIVVIDDRFGVRIKQIVGLGDSNDETAEA